MSANRPSKDQISTRLDELVALARARMDDAGAWAIGLYPTEYDWMTAEELAEAESLKLQLPRSGDEREAARARVAAKRAARVSGRLAESEALQGDRTGAR